MNDFVSRFNINTLRVTYLAGERSQQEILAKVLGSQYFLKLRPLSQDKKVSEQNESCFFIQAVNFSNQAEVQAATSQFTQLSSPWFHRILYVHYPALLSREQLLLAQEIGAKYVASGVKKNDDLRDYIKRYCVEMSTVGSMAHYERDLETACQTADRAALQRLVDKLKKLDESSEQAAIILAGAYTYLEDWKRAEFLLKRVLTINPQNLWAANSLGKLYLKTNRGAQGIEVLSKLSQFHELNSERLLVLGDAYAQAGMAEEAEQMFLKGEQLTQGGDDRFKDGLVKARIIQKDYQGSIALLAGRSLTADVIAFLNLRAIMAIKEGNFREAVEYYQYAISGAKDQVVKSKVKFNLGLAYLRHDDLDLAQACLKESLTLGGSEFTRARSPLEKIAVMMKLRQAQQDQEIRAKSDLSDLDWENLNFRT
jgi:tetratricopeptide (TPR) repeat protein